MLLHLLFLNTVTCTFIHVLFKYSLLISKYEYIPNTLVLVPTQKAPKIPKWVVFQGHLLQTWRSVVQTGGTQNDSIPEQLSLFYDQLMAMWHSQVRSYNSLHSATTQRWHLKHDRATSIFTLFDSSFTLFDSSFTLFDSSFTLFDSSFTLFDSSFTLFDSSFTLFDSSFTLFDSSFTLFDSSFTLFDSSFTLFDSSFTLFDSSFTLFEPLSCDVVVQRGLCNVTVPCLFLDFYTEVHDKVIY